MGTRPPELEMMEVSQLDFNSAGPGGRFKGVFKLGYAGNAFIDIETNIQANPLNIPTPRRYLRSGSGGLYGHCKCIAAKALLVPMEMRISRMVLKGVVVLVVDKQEGVTLVFKNDPLESVLVNSVQYYNPVV